MLHHRRIFWDKSLHLLQLCPEPNQVGVRQILYAKFVIMWSAEVPALQNAVELTVLARLWRTLLPQRQSPHFGQKVVSLALEHQLKNILTQIKL